MSAPGDTRSESAAAPERLLGEIVHAVLYEGYVLYPYRATSVKNQRERFTFGRVYPSGWSKAADEPCFAQAECLIRGSAGAAEIEVTARFLQPLVREIGVLPQPIAHWPADGEPALVPTASLAVDGATYQRWHEAVEREVRLRAAVGAPAREVTFRFEAARTLEPIRDRAGLIVAAVIRSQPAVTGVLAVSTEWVSAGVYRVGVRITNTSPAPAAGGAMGAKEGDEAGEHEQALLPHLFASTHVVLRAHGGEFVSQIDPPPELSGAAQTCRNTGVWPVLVGDEARGERTTMLAAPIILYDYPRIAPESAGPLCDGTEIDEILTLRILTLSDDEKREVRQVDAYARALLQRSEALSPEAMLKLHGTMRGGEAVAPARPAAATLPAHPAAPLPFDDFFGAKRPLECITVASVQLRAGSRVRLRPKARADVMDIALAGQTATVEAIEVDLEERVQLAVVVEADPGRDLGLMRQPGHRFFYGVDEVEPLRGEEAEG